MIIPSILLRDWRGWLASGLGSGLSPWAPGTVGTLAALVPIVWLGNLPIAYYLLACVLLFALGCIAADWVIKRFGIDDPGVVVIDEWVGFGLTWAPVVYLRPELRPFTLNFWLLLGSAFLLFRLTDILKPWPASWADSKLHGGFGAMLDDAFAGCWSALLMVLLLTLDGF